MEKITFNEIKKANESISTTEIKGKEYAEVNQRVKAFRIVYPTGFITTEFIQCEEDYCVISAEVGYYDDNGNRCVIASAKAREEKAASFINKTSYIENCDTSAVGRALGFAGFGIDTAICSAEELTNALAAQNKPDLKGDYKNLLKQIQAKTGETLGEINKRFAEEAGIEGNPTDNELRTMQTLAINYLERI